MQEKEGNVIYKHKKTGDRYRWLAEGVFEGNGDPATAVAIYCPDDNGHNIIVMKIEEFESLFEVIK